MCRLWNQVPVFMVLNKISALSAADEIESLLHIPSSPRTGHFFVPAHKNGDNRKFQSRTFSNSAFVSHNLPGTSPADKAVAGVPSGKDTKSSWKGCL